MRILACITVLTLLCVLAGCSTDRRYTVAHERMTIAAMQAISDEASVRMDEIQRNDREEDGGRLTVLRAPYVEYSKVEATIDSRGKHCNTPELEVVVSTDKILFTRHKEWEERLQRLVELKLKARPHGEESKPSALPPVKPSVQRAEAVREPVKAPASAPLAPAPETVPAK